VRCVLSVETAQRLSAAPHLSAPYYAVVNRTRLLSRTLCARSAISLPNRTLRAHAAHAQVYSEGFDTWDGVVSLFFIDTAHDVSM
jgi:hypothetical protein